jgi:hypothetical protein
MQGDTVRVMPLDSFRMRIYIASHGLWLTLDSGKFEAAEINTKTGAVRLALAPATAFTPAARLRIEQPAQVTSTGKYRPAASFKVERDAYVVPLGSETTWIELTAK